MQKIIAFFAWSLCLPFFKFFYHNKAHGLENLPSQGGIIAANHVSYLDPPLIGFTLFPRKACFLAKGALFTPILGWLLKQMGCYPVEKGRNNLAAFKAIFDQAAQGKLVVIFPEGTRSFNGKLQKGQPGVSLLIEKSKAPVIPCYIKGTYEAWGLHRKWPKLFGNTTVVFGRPIHFAAHKGPKCQVQQELKVKIIMQAIEDLKNWVDGGCKGPLPGS
jgi:1-acyl-sn-glycerol-3-phosphate acyltransferase